MGTPELEEVIDILRSQVLRFGLVISAYHAYQGLEAAYGGWSMLRGLFSPDGLRQHHQ